MSHKRFAVHVRRTVSAVFTVLCFAFFGAAAFVLGVIVHSSGTVPVVRWNALLPLITLFAILGAMYGTIVALDRAAEAPSWRFIRRFESPILRTIICAALGALAVFVVRTWGEGFPEAWIFIGGAVGAVLGRYGWRWAMPLVRSNPLRRRNRSSPAVPISSTFRPRPSARWETEPPR